MKHLNLTNFDLSKYGLCRIIVRNNYEHNCLCLALEAGGLSEVKLQQFILTLRNRKVHKCDLSNVCNALETNIEISSLRDDNDKCRVEHYPQYPFVEYDKTYKLGLVDNHDLINDTTNVTSYCLENDEEIKDINECDTTYMKDGKYYKRDKPSKTFITAFQLFKTLKTNIDKLITPILSTDELMSTQLYDTIEGYRTLDCTKNHTDKNNTQKN